MEKSNGRLGYLYGAGEEVQLTRQQRVLRMLAVQHPCEEESLSTVASDYTHKLKQIFEGKESIIQY